MKTRRLENKQITMGTIILTIALAFAWLIFTPAGLMASERYFQDSPDSRIYDETQKDTVQIVLMGVPDYEVTEIFNDILTQAPGVLEAKRIRLHIDPSHPKACYVTWRVRMDNPNLFELESNVFRMLKDIAGENTDAPVVSFSFAPTDKNLEMLRYIRPWESTSNEIAFLLDRPLPPDSKHVNSRLTRDGYRPYSHRHQVWGDTGFE